MLAAPFPCLALVGIGGRCRFVRCCQQLTCRDRGPFWLLCNLSEKTDLPEDVGEASTHS